MNNFEYLQLFPGRLSHLFKNTYFLLSLSKMQKFAPTKQKLLDVLMILANFPKLYFFETHCFLRADFIFFSKQYSSALFAQSSFLEFHLWPLQDLQMPSSEKKCVKGQLWESTGSGLASVKPSMGSSVTIDGPDCECQHGGKAFISSKLLSKSSHYHFLNNS